MKRRQREQHELKMYQKTLRYGARYDVITAPRRSYKILKRKRGDVYARWSQSQHPLWCCISCTNFNRFCF